MVQVLSVIPRSILALFAFLIRRIEMVIAVGLRFQSVGSFFCLEIKPHLVRPSNTRGSRGYSLHRATTSHVIQRTRLSSGSRPYPIASTPRPTEYHRRSSPSCTIHFLGQCPLGSRPACPISRSIGHCALSVCCSLSFGSHLG